METRSAAAKSSWSSAQLANNAAEDTNKRGEGEDAESQNVARKDSPCDAAPSSSKAGRTNAGDAEAGEEDVPAFPKFAQLPAEIRVMIWKRWLALSSEPLHPLRVRLYRGQERMSAGQPGRKRRGKARYMPTLRLAPMPELAVATRQRRWMMMICKEARYESLQLFPLQLDLRNGGILCFSPERDIIFLDIVNMNVIESLVDMRLNGEQMPAFADAIGHIGFEMAPRLPHWSFRSRQWLDPRLDFILCFPNLHSISLVNFGSFESEVDWDDFEDVNWFLARSLSHDVGFRTFRALEGVDYKEPCKDGKRVAGVIEKHDCVICTIHKCVYVRDFLQNLDPTITGRPLLTAGENKWLADLSFHTLIVSTPQMSGRMREFKGSLTKAEREEERARERERERQRFDALEEQFELDLDEEDDDDNND